MEQVRQFHLTDRDMELTGTIEPDQLLELGAPRGWLRKNRWASIVAEPSLDGHDEWIGLHNADAIEQTAVDYHGHPRETF